MFQPDRYWGVLAMVPSQYRHVFIACDTYEEASSKGGERQARGPYSRARMIGAQTLTEAMSMRSFSST